MPTLKSVGELGVTMIDLTEAQAIRLNAWAHFGPMPDVLTDEQLEQLLGTSRP